MNDPSSKSVPEPPPRADKAFDTAGSGIDGAPPTLPSNHPNAPHPAVADGPQRLGDYVIVRKIGEGGMGAVYLAEDTRLGRKAAIKTLQREIAANQVYRDRFEREARAAAAVEHDNIVPIWYVGTADDGSPFIAMPFLQGESLDARLTRVPVAGVGLILKVAREVASGLAAAHAKALVHRDIKPANIWLEGDLSAPAPVEQIRRCKILDFGLVRSLGKEDIQITTPGQSPGTPAFMSPEQAKGERVDHRSDLFSLGVTLYRMATGKLPFNGPNVMAVLIALATETPPPVRTVAPELPPALADLIDRLMCRNPNGRPQSAAEVAATARQIARDLQAGKTRVASPNSLPAEPPVRLLPAVAPPVAESISTSVPHLLPTAEELTEPDDSPEPIAPKDVKRSRLPWVIAAAIGLIVLVPLGLWQAGAFGGKKPDPNASTQKEDPPKPVPPKDEPTNFAAERKAAEFVLSVGGMLAVDDDVRDIADPKDLPKDSFRLKRVRKTGEERVNDTSLAVFKDCKHVERLDLGDTKTGDVGLAYFSGCKNLKYLALGSTQVSDTGLGTIKRFAKLTYLDLELTQVTEKGVLDLAKALPRCEIHWDGGVIKPPTGLDADRTAAEYMLSIGNPVCINEQPREYKTLAELPGEPFRLSYVNLAANPNVTDAGLANFRGCKNLAEVYLMDTPVTAAGLVHFKDSPALHTLGLDKTPMTDAGLAHLKELKNLKRLTLTQTQVTAKGVAALAKALPKCDIKWDGNSGPKEADPDRKAAEYVRSLRGCVYVNDDDEVIKADKPLPKGPLRLNAFQFLPETVVTDTGLAAFAGCQNMVSLGLSDFPVGDAGLAHFKGCKGLQYVYLANTRVTSKGLTALADCTGLMELNLSSTPVDDTALPVLKRFTKLNILDLKGTKVTAKGVAELREALPGECDIQWDGKPDPEDAADRKTAKWVLSAKGAVQVNGGGDEIKDAKALPKEPFKLTQIYLTDPVKDADLAVVAGCKNLTGAYLVGTGITNAGMAHLKDCKELKSLFLSGTKVDDKSVPVIKGFTKLTDLSVGLTELSEKSVKEIANALPGCRIQHNGGTIEPATDADRKAAEYVLSVGGKLEANYEEREIKAGKDLPKERFRLTSAYLNSNQQVTDEDLANLKDCKSLDLLYLYGTKITDRGLEHFKGCKSLTTLHLSYTKVGDAGLANFKDCKNLASLRLGKTKVTNEGLASFKDCPNLTILDLADTAVSAAGLSHFAECTKLTYLDLSRTPVNDAGLAHFKKCQNLVSLSLFGTKVTDEGLAHFKGCKGLSSLELSETDVTDIGLAHFNESTNLTGLGLANTKVTDEGLAHFKKCQSLIRLDLSGTQIGDPGLAHFKACTDLATLDLSGTKVSDASVEQLKQFTKLTALDLKKTKISPKGLDTIARALPQCEISHDGGVIKPKKK